MSRRALHVIDVAEGGWPACAALAALLQAHAERRCKTDAEGFEHRTLALGSAERLAPMRALGWRIDHRRAPAPIAGMALAIARLARREGAWAAHAWGERALAAALLARRLTPGLRVGATLASSGAAQRPAPGWLARLGGRAGVIAADCAPAIAGNGAARFHRRIIARPPWRAASLDAARVSALRRRWFGRERTVVIAHLGEPESRLDAHAFASVALALRLLGIDARGVTSARAQSIPAAIDLASRFAASDVVAFEPSPPICWLGACDIGLWGAFGATRSSERAADFDVRVAGAVAALGLGIPVVAAPAGAARLSAAAGAIGPRRAIAAAASDPIALAGAASKALRARADRAAVRSDAQESARAERAAWLAAHASLWDSL